MATRELKRILVPVKRLGRGEAVVALAGELAARFGATVEVLHVWHPRLHPFQNSADTILSLASYSEQATDAWMKKCVARLRRRGLHVNAWLLAGDPATTIVQHAADEGVDLIVLGTRGRADGSWAWRSSVVERIVRGAPCPVLTVPAREPIAHELARTPEHAELGNAIPLIEVAP